MGARAAMDHQLAGARRAWLGAALRGALLALMLAAALAVAGAATLAAAELRVPSAAALTLGAALARAGDGDRIIVAPGLYRERLVVTKAVAIIGSPGLTEEAGAGEVGAATPRAVIDGGGTGRVVELGAPGIVLSGVEIRNSGDAVEKSDACLYIRGEATGARVTDNTLADCAFGIWVHGAVGVRIEGNRISGRPRPFMSDRGNGINLWNVREGLIRANWIERVRDGIYLSVTTDSRLEGNRMRDLRFGIHYMYSDRNRVVDNETCDSHVGLALMYSKRLEIVGNRALRNGEHGILIRSIFDSVIRGNRAVGNNKGLFLNDSSFNEIASNWVEENAIGVHVTGGSEDNRVAGNTFLRNQAQVLFTWRQSLYWDDGGRGNYWSDYLGWDMDGDGVGDRTYYASGTMDRLVYRYPLLKVLAASPVVRLMQSLEARFPVLRPASVIDRHPAMRPLPLAGRDGAGEKAASGSGTLAEGVGWCATAPPTEKRGS